MTEITWSDKMGHRGRSAWALVVVDGKIMRFAGESIPGIVAVKAKKYEKNGKWSNTTYALAIGKGVRFIGGKNGWETGSFREGLRDALPADSRKSIDGWADIASELGVEVSEAQRFLRAFRPREADEIDAAEAAIASLR
jgi:hypothetical protein